MLLLHYYNYKGKIKMRVFKTNTEFHRLVSGPSNSEFVKIPWIVKVLWLHACLWHFVLLFLSANIANKDKFYFLGVPTPISHIFILLWGEKLQQCLPCWEPQGRASSAESRCSLMLRPWIVSTHEPSAFPGGRMICHCECIRNNEGQRGQPKPPHQGRALA